MHKYILWVVLALFGGFYDWNAALIGAVLCFYLLLLSRKKHCVYKKEKKWQLWIPEGIFLFQILVTFWAVDASANMAGILRGAVLLLWMHICFQWTQETRWELLHMIPNMGVCIVLAGSVALLGILFTGSRSVLLIGIAWGILHSLRHKNFRRVFLPVLIGTGASSGIYFVITGKGTQNISRIFTVLSANSTLYGRALYDIDGISILMKHPMGLGYLGYHYVQHAWQTGVYTVLFLHNDILQLGVDYGLPSMLLFAVYILWQIVRGKQGGKEKTILAVIIIASLIDFHMQYLMIDFILILCLDQGERSRRQKRLERIENNIFISVILCGFLFVFLSLLLFRK